MPQDVLNMSEKSFILAPYESAADSVALGGKLPAHSLLRHSSSDDDSAENVRVDEDGLWVGQ